ncbi:response regulator transcription factor [Streptomyces caeni]|uniref:Response regulator transcription factor n=1 Tax=Streptomyces caeni TaxID=2307231 RepID=A0ABW4IVW4_9ACTN
MSMGVQALLERQEGIRVRVESSTAQALSLARREPQAAVIVISPTLTVDNKEELAQFAAVSKVVFLAKGENTHRSLEALALGVRAVLSVESSAEHLLQVLQTVIAMDAIIMPFAARDGLDQIAAARGSSALAVRTSETLTLREKEVTLLLTQGYTNTEIARKLSITPTTVRSHVHHLLKKLGAASRAQAIALAYETGLIGTIERQLVRTQ